MPGDQYSNGGDGCGEVAGKDGNFRGGKGGRGGGGGGGGGGRRGGGRGGGGAGMKFNRIVPSFLRQYEGELQKKPMKTAISGEDGDDEQPTVAQLSSKMMQRDMEQAEEEEEEWDDVQKAALQEYEHKTTAKISDDYTEKMKEKIRLKAQKRKVVQRVAERLEQDKKEEDSGKHSFRSTKKIKLGQEQRKEKEKKGKKIKNKKLLSFDMDD
jgi:hypothetical protein